MHIQAEKYIKYIYKPVYIYCKYIYIKYPATQEVHLRTTSYSTVETRGSPIGQKTKNNCYQSLRVRIVIE